MADILCKKCGHVVNAPIEKCPICGSTMILRNGKYGQFFGCSNYPKCKGIKKL